LAGVVLAEQLSQTAIKLELRELLVQILLLVVM
jgi:hypothetical protein